VTDTEAPPAREPRRSLSRCLALATLLAFGTRPVAADGAAADVVVVVDTSTSMREPGMDPERSSLLVSRLLADISPGSLAVVRLLDLHGDADLLRTRSTGEQMPCSEDPSRQCERVDAANDWWAEARAKHFGALVRPARADGPYKQALAAHLEQRINNSLFDVALRSAQGLLEQRRQQRGAAPPLPQIVVWLSDGRSDNESLVASAVGELGRAGVGVEAIVFGRGDDALPRHLGLPTHKVKTPGELMQAFAGVFRRVVQAPYEVDALLTVAPAFEMKPGVDEAWIVVYGDDTLSGAEVEGPGGRVAADYAADRWPGAGAYRVAYLQRPAAGRWVLHASGGGAGAAYAVVQRSALLPLFLGPQNAVSGVTAVVVAGIGAGAAGPLRDPAVLAGVELTAESAGTIVRLHDDGRDGDQLAGDGRFSGSMPFHAPGDQPVRIRLRTPLVDRVVEARVRVAGRFVADGKPVELDLGRLGAAAEVCRPLRLPAVHEGQVPLSLRALRRLPGGHRLWVALPGARLEPAGEPRLVAPGDALAVCLATGPRAASSLAAGEPWLELAVAGTNDARQRVTLRLRWQVEGLGFWARWGWLLMLILGLLVLSFVVGGYVVPERFQPSLSLVFGPDREDLEEQSPQPLRQWRGVGIGFYRNARAFLHPDFRLSGNARGAVAGLEALAGGTRVIPAKGATLQREALDGGWEPVAPEGRTGHAGDVYRVGDRGPYFRLTSRRGTE
jgi:hypothetical protein